MLYIVGGTLFCCAQVVSAHRISHEYIDFDDGLNLSNKQTDPLAWFKGHWQGSVDHHLIQLNIYQITEAKVAIGQLTVDGVKFPFQADLEVSKIPQDYQFKLILSAPQVMSLTGRYTFFIDAKSTKNLRSRFFNQDQSKYFQLLKY